ncbi:MAG TPA: alpha-ketoglutarate-dependent dioxygenase AlkB [Ilumatobacter sp.]|nr:alpha-ketoglutarate-dependent dioxygenase AlkB [Ilumatobacter sp.]
MYARIEQVFYQGSLLGMLPIAFDANFANVRREQLDATTWVDHAANWCEGSDDLFDELTSTLPLRQRTGVHMYEQIVDEPRLSAWWRLEGGADEHLPVLREMRLALADHYGEPFDSIGFNLYRDRHDSVAWHGDRHRHVATNPIVAIVSVGCPRPLRLRRRDRSAGRGPSKSWNLGNGDLFVMGGACQHEWEHTVPKVGNQVGPRLSITFRSV